jgi:hypothetical protein
VRRCGLGDEAPLNVAVRWSRAWAPVTIVAQTYRSPIPRGAQIRSPESGWTRANVKVLDTQTSLNGRRLCENTVGLLEERGVASWTRLGVVDRTTTGSAVELPLRLKQRAIRRELGAPEAIG